MILPSADNSRSVYQINVTASDTERAETVVARILCPVPDHAPPCPVSWESRSSITGGVVYFVLYATDSQAQEILAEVTAQDCGDVSLFKSIGENGEPIDGSTVIEQFLIEHSLPER